MSSLLEIKQFCSVTWNEITTLQALKESVKIVSGTLKCKIDIWMEIIIRDDIWDPYIAIKNVSLNLHSVKKYESVSSKSA